MTSTATATCGHTTDVPATLCPKCTNQLREHLERLPDAHRALAAWLAPAGRRPELGSTHAVEAPIPVREEVLSLRGPGGIVGILEDWASAVRHARGFTTTPGAGTVEGRVSDAASTLYQNLTWISLTWDLGTQLAGEIRLLHSRCLAIIDPPDHTVPIGSCPADLGDGRICGTTIRVPEGTTDVYCRGCNTRFPPKAWLNLRQWMITDEAKAAERAAA
jgi:hypothetical protein